MRNRAGFLPAVLLLLGTAAFAWGSLGHARPQPAVKQFVLLMKATAQDSFKKTQEPEGKRLVAAHLKKLQALTEAGICIFSGRTLVTDESGFGIIVVRVESEAAAQKIIDDDDLVKAGLVRGTVFPFQVVTSGR